MAGADGPVRVFSEIGPLKTVLLHRPGNELESLTPQYLDSMLFEDIPFLSSMQEEHDQFAALLEEHGSRVLYMKDLLTDVLADDAVRRELIGYTAAEGRIPDRRLRELLQNHLSAMRREALAESLIAGVRKTDLVELGGAEVRNLSYYIRDEYPFFINPLPNLYFTRDPGSVIGSSWVINSMKTEARKRESRILQAVAARHPLFTAAGESFTLVEGFAGSSSIEGGDILVLNRETAAVGCSARTDTWAIEELARRILSPSLGSGGEGFRTVLVIQIPFTRAYMHLDTVFTMVDHDKFTIYPAVEADLKVFSLTASGTGELKIEPERSLKQALRKTLKLPAVDLIKTGGGDRITAAREQWNDSTNTLALAPGVVVTYRRNVVSNDTLEKHGVTVLPIRGSELVRGRGGPRCMSMPLARDDAG
jgi:arginine deiminase